MSTHMFSWRNKKDISSFWTKKALYLLLWLLIMCDTAFLCNNIPVDESKNWQIHVVST